MSQSKRNYTNEFKKDAISLAISSPSIKSAAKDLGIPEGTLSTWLRNTTTNQQGKNNNENIDVSGELKKLRKENSRLREEKEILKKFATFFVREST
jgi:transposase